jgi:hypothetical protein
MLKSIFYVAGALSSRSFGVSPLAARSTHLPSCLSAGAEVYYPRSEEFANSTLRWSAGQTPQYDIVVKVATEKDVQETVNALITHSNQLGLC